MAQNALAGLAALLGWTHDEAMSVAVANADPVLRTRYRVGEAAAAALGACGIAANRLWMRRGGAHQALSVDLRHAAASLRSNRYLALEGPRPPDAMDKLTGFYPVANGRWVYLHCNFAHHRAGIARLLDASPERTSFEARTTAWDGYALEEALAAAGMPGGLARALEEWQKHGQAHAIAALPVLEVIRIGDSRPEPLPKALRPLAGIRVLDLTRVIAGPTAARTLAEHGADVLKINAADLPNSGFLEFDTGHGKRAAFLDLRRRDEVETLRDLAAKADVFSQSYRPGALAAKGFAPEDLARLHPGIVCVTLSAYSQAGIWRGRRGFDSIIQTVSGMALTQSGTAKPQLLPCSAIDYVSGYLLACGAMVALERRAVEGGSWLVRTSLAQVGRWIVAQGLLPTTALDGVPADFEKGELERWLTGSETPLGPLTHLAPALRMSATPPRWERPAVPLGHHAATWEG
jgi:hypothetical protein